MQHYWKSLGTSSLHHINIITAHLYQNSVMIDGESGLSPRLAESFEVCKIITTKRSNWLAVG